ncbi:hypothetical protein CLOHYLEM_04343 [[Clostridium] hylemonae DSM 15053]|uniref:Uncharacterized protein n=1 Tax=[Clostridium] hylemonae DSM 15053 TaxID=553973 RepID=C0BX09_9FIRM|nr:hypothetical protein CLOHYLEM_04343 [[Clostridium] hylemonae DSM 15053]
MQKKSNRTFVILLLIVYNMLKEVKTMREQNTDAVDELLIKYTNAKKKKFKVI